MFKNRKIHYYKDNSSSRYSTVPVKIPIEFLMELGTNGQEQPIHSQIIRGTWKSTNYPDVKYLLLNNSNEDSFVLAQRQTK